MAEILPLRARLPKADPALAAASGRLLAVLSAAVADDGARRLNLRAALDPEPACGVWLQLRTPRGEAALQPGVIDGQPVAWLEAAEAPILPEALSALTRLEPVIAAVERACGLALEPVGLGAASASGVVSVQALDEEGAVIHRLRLAFDAAAAAAWPEPVFDPARLGPAGDALVGCSLILQGPPAPRRELAELGKGDLVLLAPVLGGGWAGHLCGPGGGFDGRFDPAQSCFTIFEETSPMLEAEPPLDPADAPAMSPASMAADLPVRLRVVLPEVKLPLKAVAALRPGATISLPTLGEDLPVEILADQTPIAWGRLVALGDAYGVLVDRLREG